MQRLEKKIKKTEEENSSGGLFSCCRKKNAIETQKREASQNAYVNTGKKYIKIKHWSLRLFFLAFVEPSKSKALA